jgi:2-polyprenyl-3-methyl-5-hydroxy-6-metoxy-1,4-benzoquinol methylase
MSFRGQETEQGRSATVVREVDADLFDDAYFEAGALRRSRALTQSAYEGIVFSPLRRLRPQVLDGRGRRALEIGCGYGYCSELLANLGYKVTGADISLHAIERARREVSRPDVDFVVWDATTKSRFEESFEIIVAFEVVEHLSDPENALRAWRKLLCPGGTLLLTTPNKLGPAARYWRDPTHVNVRGRSGWRRALRESGPWAHVTIGAVQGVPYLWRWTNVMHSLPLPLFGATLRITASKP